MADRSAAYLFGSVFELIDAHVPEEKRKKVALDFWNRSRDYDFSPYQMGQEDVLQRLGLARRGVDPDWPNDGETWIYGPSVAGEMTR